LSRYRDVFGLGVELSGLVPLLSVSVVVTDVRVGLREEGIVSALGAAGLDELNDAEPVTQAGTKLNRQILGVSLMIGRSQKPQCEARSQHLLAITSKMKGPT
jgi:hypothetical protein